MKNILTIDLEDWYHGIELPQSSWTRCEDRIERNADKLLSYLSESKTKATFFVLGCVAEKFPSLVREIAEEGHEVGTHGYAHEFVYKLTKAEFELDLLRSIDCLEQCIGDKVKGYRAPYFSITKESFWALEVIGKHGIEYDSSIFPIKNYRYGIPDAKRFPNLVDTKNGQLLEIPISTIEISKQRFSFFGGFYLRFSPYCFIKQAIQWLNKQGQPAVIYLHPWELDPNHPRLKELPLRIKLTHYYNLKSTERKLRRLLRDFEFIPAGEFAVKFRNTENS